MRRNTSPSLFQGPGQKHKIAAVEENSETKIRNESHKRLLDFSQALVLIAKDLVRRTIPRRADMLCRYRYCTDQGYCLYLRLFSVCELAKPKQSKSRNDSGIDNFWANVYLVSPSSIVEHRIQFVRLKILPLLHWSTLGLKVRSLQSCEMRAVEVLFKIG